MDPKEIKACLKAAREAIRDKEFKDAAKHCKTVLAADPNNYNALVFLGVATEGLDKGEQALKAYKKATELQPDQLLAWQGISSMLDKNPKLMSEQESTAVFQKLISLHSNDEIKQLPQLYKLLDLYLRSDQNDEALQTLDMLLKFEKDAAKRIQPLCSFITLKSSIAPKLPETDLQKYESSLREVIFTEENSIIDRDHYVRLFLVFISQMKLNELPLICEQLIQAYPALPSPFEFLLRLAIDSAIGEGYPSQARCEDVKELTSALEAVNEDNCMVKVGLAFTEIQNRNFVAAKELLSDVPDDCISGLYFMGQTCLYLHSYIKCLEACERGLLACSEEKRIICAPTAHILCLFKLAKVEACMGLNTLEAQAQALIVLEEVQEQMPTEAFLMKAYILLDQGKINEAEECVQYLPANALSVQTLQATILFKKESYTSAWKILERVVKEDDSDARATLLLGKVLWELQTSDEANDIRQQCFTTLLKAAKLDPYNAEAFLLIGNFYKHIQQDLVKARRCFQKAYDLYPESDNCSAALVNALLELREEEQALKILEKVTKMAPAGSAKWAWIRLGLHQMRQDDPSTAIMSLQCALRADPDDHSVWECLAEAYLQRGSFTAALKAFTKASELNPDSWYCSQQIAGIKHILGLAAEAIEGYKTVLQKSPTYVPALKGVSESLIQLAKQNLSQCLDGLAQGNFEEAIEYTARAATQRPDMSCLWKLMGDACTAASCLSFHTFRVPAKLFNKQVQGNTTEDKVGISKMELLIIGSRCYNQAIRILPESGYLWHDLGVNLFNQSQCCNASCEDHGDPLALASRAAQVMNKAISLEPKEWRLWNALGVIACSKVYHKPALAQHCFIKSVECESCNATAWTNLGALYLDKGEVKLAHDAFTAAQSIDPTYMACWIGQALIAELIGHEEAMDLFRHTTELGFHVESASSYGQWVLSIMADDSKRDSDLFRYCIQQMAALPAASDALTKYTTRVKDDATALNMQGLLFEHQNLLRSSVAAFQKALGILESSGGNSESINKTRLNLARVLCKLEKFDESVQCYDKCDMDSNINHMCIYALAVLRCGRVEDSVKVYQIALDLAQGTPVQSDVCVALGMIAFMQGDLGACKSHLFDGFQTAQPSLNGLLALCSLGLLQGDSTLATAVLDELHKRKVASFQKRDILFLNYYMHSLEMDAEAEKAAFEEYLQDDPSNAVAWSLLARTTLSCSEENTKVAVNHAKAALEQGSKGSERGRLRMLESLSHLSAGHHSRLPEGGNALKSALKAFHANPGCVSAHMSLACAVHAEAEIQRALNGTSDLFEIECSLLQTALADGHLKGSLQAWCLQSLLINSIIQGENEKVGSFLQQLQEKHSDAPDVQVFLQIMTKLLSGQTNATLSTASYCLLRLSLLVNCSLQEVKGDINKSLNLLLSAVEEGKVINRASKIQSLWERIAFKSCQSLQESGDLSLQGTLDNAVSFVKNKEASSPILSFLQAVQTMRNSPDNKRLIKFHLATSLDQVDTDTELGFLSTMLRCELLSLLWDSKKETDRQMVKGLLDDAKAKRDKATAAYFKNITSSETNDKISIK